MTAIDIGHPLAGILAVIKIQHGSYRIHTDSVGMVLLSPVESIGDQEIGHLRPAVIVDQGSPVRMRSLPWILVLIDTGSVKTGQSHQISWKMSRHPVKNHADSLSVKIIHEILKIIRCSIAAGRRIVTGHLIPPGCI